ncbi:methyltransferase domain-containing protein [Natrialba swarupiae]|uniref:Methyltransferase domain-containing protein n=1 Tax=Natrialba swarupiae TaxID=2448032 RepID=A0A5D5AQ40_9EURY|nr:methyltransferase domain-containing protein [Natrialba swarupiae]
MQSYLAAKRTVDDRALNRRVLERFSDELAGVDDPARVVEFGFGVGTMIERLAEWGRLPERTSYRAIDRDPENVAAARARVPDRLEPTEYRIVDDHDSGWAATREDVETAELDRVETADFGERTDGRSIALTLEVGDALSPETIASGDATAGNDACAEAVVAAAFLDVVDLERALESIAAALEPGGLLYAPITFDGATGFAPSHPLDDRIERLYHRHMDEIRDAGASTTGRQLLASLPANGFEMLAAGGSDWIVRPRSADEGSGYPATERTFLQTILETIDEALAAYPADVLDPADRRAWLSTRRRQLEESELSFVAHHVDVLARLENN